MSIAPLTKRELECLKWCAVGKSYWETSVILEISERTVNFHMASVREKFGASSNAHAVAKGIANELIPIKEILAHSSYSASES